MNNYILYVHIAPNGKKYIGITSRNPKKRWANGKGYKNNMYFCRAIEKYGWKNIEHIILFTNLTKEEAEKKEIELIAKYKTTNRKFGYNINNGGNCVGTISEETKIKISIANKGKKVSEETREKMRKANLGKHHSQETREKMSKNNTKYWKDKHHSQETKEKLRKANLGKKLSEEQKIKISNSLKGRKTWNEGIKMKPRSDESKKKLSKQVICIETQTIYFGTREAERQTGISHVYISKCCNKKSKTARGYHWRYYNE